MGYEKEASYGTFEGQEPGPQPNAPAVIPQGVPSYPGVPGYPVLGNYSRNYQGSGTYQEIQCQGSNCNQHCECAELPFCGIGFGWFLFFLGFILAGVPWYAGACCFLFLKHDKREQSGLVACTIAALMWFFLCGVSLHLHINSGNL